METQQERKRTGDRVHFDGGRWGWRTIHPGARVKWLGKWYRLKDGALTREEFTALSRESQPLQDNRPKYDGSMDGQTALFYTYGRHYVKDEIYLHSSLDQSWPGPACVEGYFVWETFIPEASKRAKR